MIFLPTAPKNGHEKRQRFPVSTEAPLPVICYPSELDFVLIKELKREENEGGEVDRQSPIIPRTN